MAGEFLQSFHIACDDDEEEIENYFTFTYSEWVSEPPFLRLTKHVLLFTELI